MKPDPFAPPLRKRVASRIRDMLAGDTDERLAQERIGVEMAEAILEWAAKPYHRKFLEWLRKEADKPMPLDAHAKMIVASTRSNTLREIITRLELLVSKAKGTLDREG